jgi:hypothetical protein
MMDKLMLPNWQPANPPFTYHIITSSNLAITGRAGTRRGKRFSTASAKRGTSEQCLGNNILESGRMLSRKVHPH